MQLSILIFFFAYIKYAKILLKEVYCSIIVLVKVRKMLFNNHKLYKFYL